MIRRIWASALSLFVAAAVVAGCGGAPTGPTTPAAPTPGTNTGAPATGETKAPAPKQTTYPITLKDGAGRDVTIPAEPKRVISVMPSNTEITFALGKQSALVGRSDFDDYPAEAKQIESVGGFFPPNYEKLVGLKPDLILLGGGSDDARNKLINDYKLNVYVVDPKNFAELYSGIKNLGTILNAQEPAEKLVAQMQSDIKAIGDKAAKATAKPKVFYETWNDPLMTAGSGTFIDEMIKTAGGENVGAAVKGWANFGAEQLVAANPDIYIANNADAVAKAKANTGFANIKAIKAGQVVPLQDENIVNRPGPRMVQGLKWFFETLHPELK
jgi:iron complex transport system substrate-binding protein